MRPLSPAGTPAPCCRYGATKVLVEAAAAAAHWAHGQSIICLRLGAVLPEPPSAEALAGWLGPADLQQLVTRSVEAEEVGFAVYYGISANTRSYFDISNVTREIGYRPILDAEMYADRVPSGVSYGLCPSVSQLAPRHRH